MLKAFIDWLYGIKEEPKWYTPPLIQGPKRETYSQVVQRGQKKDAIVR